MDASDLLIDLHTSTTFDDDLAELDAPPDLPPLQLSSANGTTSSTAATAASRAATQAAAQAASAYTTAQLTQKIQTLLSTSSHSDAGIRDALGTLDARGVTNSAETRRDLRLDLQREILDANSEVVRDFGGVVEQLRSLGHALETLQSTCNLMRQHITTAHTEAQPVVTESNRLLANSHATSTRQTLLEATTSHFLLSPTELISLTSSAEPINPSFFAALTKAKRIRHDSHVLLGLPNQRLGLDVLEQSSKHLNAAYPKLYRWLQREIKSLDLEGTPIINADVRRALRVLAERPSLFQNCLEGFAEAREHALSDTFYAALTGAPREGSTGPSQAMGAKPLELSAHEPLRYIGDMLAWAHAATVSEREALESLFVGEGGDEIGASMREGLALEPWARPRRNRDTRSRESNTTDTTNDDEESAPVFDGLATLHYLVNRNISGIGRQLRQRIEQVIHSHDEPVLAYKAANLISFYISIFTRFLPSGASFLDTLAWLETAALTQFRKSTEFGVKALLAEHPTVPQDLSVPEWLDEALDVVAALLRSFDTSVAGASAGSAVSSGGSGARGEEHESQHPGLRLILAEALEPYLDLCADVAAPLDQPANAIFTINILLAAKAPLTPYSFTSIKTAALDTAMSAQVAILVKFMHSSFLEISKLAPILAELRTADQSDLRAVTALPTLAPAALRDASEALDAFLPTALSDGAAELQGLRSKKVVNEVVRGAADKFIDDFGVVEGWLVEVDEAGLGVVGADGDDEVRLLDLWPRTSEEISILLS